MWVFGQDDRGFGVDAEVVQRRDKAPAVHLALVDLLRAVIKARGVAQTHSIGGRKDAEIGVRIDDLVLVEQGQLAVHFQHTLDHEHHIRTAGVVFVEHDGGRVAQGPRQDTFLEISDLLAVLQLDRILADQVNPRDMAVEVHADRRPVQARGHLFDMGRFTRAVIALDHHAAVMRKPGEDRERRVRVELVRAVERGHPVGRIGKALDDHVRVDAEHFANRDFLGWFCIDVHRAVRHFARPST